MSREQLYVAMTRGRDQNVAYTVTEQPLELHSDHRPDAPTSGREVLATVMGRVDESSRSAHETLRSSYQQAESLERLVPEYEDALTIAHDARITQALTASLEARGLDADRVREDPAYGALARRMATRIEDGRNVEADLQAAVAMRELATADSVAQVLTHRLDRMDTTAAPSTPAAVPAASSPGLARWLQERRMRIAAREAHLLSQARSAPQPWLRVLQVGGHRLDDAVLQPVVTYRDRHGVTDTRRALGTEPQRGSSRHDEWSTLQGQITQTPLPPSGNNEPDHTSSPAVPDRGRPGPSRSAGERKRPPLGRKRDQGPQMDR